jgi:hypothetical protein
MPNHSASYRKEKTLSGFTFCVNSKDAHPQMRVGKGITENSVGIMPPNCHVGSSRHLLPFVTMSPFYARQREGLSPTTFRS